MDTSRKAKHMPTPRAFFIALMLLLSALLSACSFPVSPLASPPLVEHSPLFLFVERANPSWDSRGDPAARYCRQVGGTVTMHTRGDGRAYRLCQFTDNRACEVWTLLRGQCPVGGVRITGFNTIAQDYCAWLGGETLAVPQATCTLPGGKICDDDALYNGTCDDPGNQHMPNRVVFHPDREALSQRSPVLRRLLANQSRPTNPKRIKDCMCPLSGKRPGLDHS